MSALGFTGSLLVFLLSFALSFLVIAYRTPFFAALRSAVDRGQARFTGRRDWSWLRLWHILLPLLAVTAVNVAWHVSQAQCADDSFAILASGQAALHGLDPFSVAFCGHSYTTGIPYGLAEVTFDALGALSGSILGIWVVWQCLALAVVPLVWAVAGKDRRYTSVLAASSVLYLPNIATNLGVENAIAAVAVLVMLYAITVAPNGGKALQAVAAFLSTARFPAVFPLLGSSASHGRRRWLSIGIVISVFLGAAAVSWALWGWDAIGVVYVGQFSRANSESLNLFALLLHPGWVQPSLATAAVQGAGVLLVVLFVQVRGYSPIAACSASLVGVMLFSQYLNYHFLVWMVPVVLLSTRVNWWLLAYAAVAAADENVLYWNLALSQGIWWPYELCGAVLAAILVVLLLTIVREEEVRLRSATSRGRSGPEARAGDLRPA
jgi:hypothetical protein